MNPDERAKLETAYAVIGRLLGREVPVSNEPPGWLEIAKSEVGTREIRGDQHNPRVLEYHATTGLSADDDETPWCSSFVNWCLAQAGVAGTNSARARSWLTWGHRVGVPRPGCVAVFSRPPRAASGHVAFYLGRTSEIVSVLGGNQGNSVSIREYPVARLLDYRMPGGE